MEEAVAEVGAGRGMMAGGEEKRCQRELVAERSGRMGVVDEEEGSDGRGEEKVAGIGGDRPNPWERGAR